MNPRELFARNCEHAKGITVAQICFGGERETGQIRQAAAIRRMHTCGIKLGAIHRRIVVGAVQCGLQAFELQMYVLESCAILLEGSQLSDAQRTLWQNIQKARLGQYAELKWPFPLVGFQESRGLSSYIQGFLDATATNKKILCLGHLDFIQHSNILHLASLEEMIAQPLLKRRLWQLMQ